MPASSRVFCTFCEQTFSAEPSDKFPLCGKVGGLMPAPAIPDQPPASGRPNQPRAMGYPVSNTCPKCGSADFKKRRPDKLIAFSWDRVCKACATRYTPPTPTWAAVVFILAGLLLAGFGAFSIIWRGNSGNPAGIPALACEGFLGLLGVLALVQEIKTLVNPGRV